MNCWYFTGNDTIWQAQFKWYKVQLMQLCSNIYCLPLTLVQLVYANQFSTTPLGTHLCHHRVGEWPVKNIEHLQLIIQREVVITSLYYVLTLIYYNTCFNTRN